MALERLLSPYSQSTHDRPHSYVFENKTVIRDVLEQLLYSGPSVVRLLELQFSQSFIYLRADLLVAATQNLGTLQNPNISFRIYRPEDLLDNEKLPVYSKFLRDLTFYPHFYPQVPQKHPVFPALISQTGVLREGETPIKVLTINQLSKEPIVGCISVYGELSEVPDARFAFRPVIRDGEPTFLIWDNDRGFIRPSEEDSNLITFASSGTDLLEISSGGGFLCIPKINLQVLVPPK